MGILPLLFNAVLLLSTCILKKRVVENYVQLRTDQEIAA
jgi:hypothetical protein